MARNGYKILDSDMHVYVRGDFALYNTEKIPLLPPLAKGNQRRHGVNGLTAPLGLVCLELLNLEL